MAWFQVDDQLAMHRKVCEAGNAAMGLWVRAGAWSMANLTEGFVSSAAAKTLGTRAQAKSLVDAGLWIASEGGYQFHEWGTRQMSAEQIAERRRKRAEAGAKGGQRSGESRRGNKGEANREANHEANASAEPKQKRTPVPVPVPTQKNSSGYVSQSATEPDAHGISATPGAELVRELIPNEHPAGVRTMLRLRANELLRAGHPRSDVAAALQLWLTKPSLGPNALPSVLSEVVKARTAPPKPANKLRSIAALAAEARAAEQTVTAGRELT